MRTLILLTSFLALAQSATTQSSAPASPPSAAVTAYDRGPDGLEAWTDDHHTRQFRTNTEPFGIVVARNGKRIRYIGEKDGGPFFWNVMLLPDGKRIAYQTGPFHTSMTCTLMDIGTGKHLEDVSCFSAKDEETLSPWALDLIHRERNASGFHLPQSGARKAAIRSK